MKHLLLILLLAILLVSCWTNEDDKGMFSSYTPQQRLDNLNAMKPVCDAQDKQTLINEGTWEAYCSYNNLVQDCIDKYIDSIDEKYNNPDTVSQLQDSNFSEAVKTCNEVFGKTK